MIKFSNEKDLNLGEYILEKTKKIDFSNSVFKVDDLENPRRWLEFVDDVPTGRYINIFVPNENHPYVLTGPSKNGVNRWTYAFRLDTGIKHFEGSSFSTREEAFHVGLNKFFSLFQDTKEYIYQFEKSINEGNIELSKRIVEANSNYRNRGFA